MAAKSGQCQLGDIMAEVTMYLPKSNLLSQNLLMFLPLCWAFLRNHLECLSSLQASSISHQEVCYA